jgi:hypothetical protein
MRRRHSLYSLITRHAIDMLKSPAMRDKVTKDVSQLIIKFEAGLWDLDGIRKTENPFHNILKANVYI